MSKDKNKQLKIKFDHDWYYCCLPSTAEDIDITVITNSSNNDDCRHWNAIQLPHIIRNKEGESNSNSIDNQQNWWYRRQFEWKASRQNLDHQFDLMFESLKDNYSSVNTFTVWLNEIKIVSNSFQSPNISIDLTEHIVYKDETENNGGKNTLIVCCTHTSLSLHVYLLLPRNMAHAIEQENIDVDRKKTVTELPFRKNRVLDYLIGFNDVDGQFDIDFNTKLKSPTQLKQQNPSDVVVVSGNDDQPNELENSDVERTLPFKTNHIVDYLVHLEDIDYNPKLKSPIQSKQKNPPDIVITEDHDQTNQEKVDNNEPTEDYCVPRLAIVMLIVGTRGDVQPFVAFGQTLRAAGHRVRLATHEKFRKYVREHDLEFYPIASNPDDLMSFMVKNSGVIPSIGSILEGDLKTKRHDIWNILQSTWLACTENDDETLVPFTAEVIIANPPSFGHVHCAQKLQIPLHMIFTMPWSPTTVFSHPFCKVDHSKIPKEKLNLISYSAIDTLTWSSMHDLANKFRRETLDLPPLHTRQAVRMLIDEQIPHTYCWSPSLVPTPHDWPEHINVAGYFFLNSDQYEPPANLVAFLGLDNDDQNKEKLSPPIYIGFGSITGNDSDRLLKMIIDALARTGYRAVLSGFNENNDELPDYIFKIGDVPHDWLFNMVRSFRKPFSAVCHHGGAGTTAAGLRAGKPSIIIPFFGDQFFWGNVIEKSGAGPSPLPGKHVTTEGLVEAFKLVHQSPMRVAAEHICEAISHENGCATALRMFHTHLPLSRMRSDLEPTFAACYRVDEFDLQVSRPVAQVLVATGALDESQFRSHSTREWTSIYDDRVHVPTSGVLKHTQKAFSHIFIHTAGGMRRAASGSNLLVGIVTGVGGASKNVAEGVGHLYLGVLSLYGEFTDVLDRLPSLYDPYSESDAHERPRVTDFKSGARAAGLSIAYGWKDGVTGFIRKPRVGYRRHGIIGGATGALVATANGLVKPIVGSLASVTWLGRGMYANMRKKKKRKDGTDQKHILINRLSVQSSISSSSSLDNSEEEQQDDDDDDNVSKAIKFAALVSGYPTEVCQQILDEFDKVKEHQEELAASSPNHTDKHRHKYLCRLHRCHSDSAL